jgi:hypothetical protein
MCFGWIGMEKMRPETISPYRNRKTYLDVLFGFVVR